LDERPLIGGVGAGDPHAMELFVRQHERSILRVVRDAGVPAADIHDVSQEILLEVLRQLSAGQFEGRSSVRTWLKHVAHGRIVDYWRGRGRRALGHAVSLDAVESADFNFSTPAAQETRLLAEEALATMPVRHRVAITAHCRGGMSVEELARLFGLSEKRTRNLITEAKAMFRSHVCGHGKMGVRRRLDQRDE